MKKLLYKTKQVNIRMPVELVAAIDQSAFSQQRTVTAVYIRGMSYYLKAKKRNP